MQVIDKELYALREEKDKLPKAIEEKERLFEEKKKALLDVEEKYKNLLKDKKDKELQLASKEENIAKLQSQLYSIKTNKEYTAMLHEIEAAKADKSALEDGVLVVLEQMDSVRQEESEEKEVLSKEEEAFRQEKKRFEDRIKEIEQRISQLDSQRKLAVEGIDAKILSKYERVLHGRQGIAIAPVVNYSCQGCFMNVTAQIVNEIKMYEKIMSCEACQRILYLEDEP